MKSRENKKGMTLVEVVVAVAVFSIVMSAASSLFASNIRTKNRSDKGRVAYERMQNVMNIVAKTLRTSSVISSDSQKVRVYDYSQGKCIEFSLSSNSLRVMEADLAIDQKDTCVGMDLGSGTDLSDSRVTGNFYVTATDTASNRRGRVTMSLKVCPDDADCSSTPSAQANMQTTISLRDYE